MWRIMAVIGLSCLLVSPSWAASRFGVLACLQWLWPKTEAPKRVGASAAEKEKFAEQLNASLAKVFKDIADPAKRHLAIFELQYAFLHKYPNYFWPQYRHWLKKIYQQVLAGERPLTWLEVVDAHWGHPYPRKDKSSRRELEAWQLADVDSFLNFYRELYKTDGEFQKGQTVASKQALYFKGDFAQKFFATVDVSLLSKELLAKVEERLGQYFATAKKDLEKSSLPAEWCLDHLPRGLKLIYLAAEVDAAAAKQRQMDLRRWLKQDIEAIVQDAPVEDQAYYRILKAKIYAKNVSEDLLAYVAQEFTRMNFLTPQENPNAYLQQRHRLQAFGELLTNPVYASLLGPSLAESFYGMALRQAARAALQRQQIVVEEEEIGSFLQRAVEFRNTLQKAPHRSMPLPATDLAMFHSFWQELAAILSPAVLTQHHWDVQYHLWRN